MIIIDTSGLIAAVNGGDPRHAEVADVLLREPGPLVLSPFCLAEADYLAVTRWGVDREVALLDEVSRAYELAAFDASELDLARKIVARYADHEIGLADASIVVLAHRHRTRRVLTLDERHFRVLRGPGGKPFTILPADAPNRDR